MRMDSMDLLLIGGVILLLAGLAWRAVAGGGSRRGSAGLPRIPSGLSFAPTVVFSEAELLLYNLVRLAAEDRYLVFADIPLWRIVSIDGADGPRRQVLKQLVLKRVDIALVHPGTRQVEQVIKFERERTGDAPSPPADQMIRDVLQLAGIRVTVLKPGQTYTVQQLEQLLSLAEVE